jgi:transcriptional regulator with XRE-family HTH domain
VEWREGDVIRRLRTAAGWKLKHLAAASGVDLQVIHRLEIGKTKEAKRATLMKIAGAFGLTDRQLIDAIPKAIDLPVMLADVPRPLVAPRKRKAS